VEWGSTEDTITKNIIIFPRFPITDPDGRWITSVCEVAAAQRANSANQGTKSRTLRRESVDSRLNDSTLCSNCVATDRRMRVRMRDYVQDMGDVHEKEYY